MHGKHFWPSLTFWYKHLKSLHNASVEGIKQLIGLLLNVSSLLKKGKVSWNVCPSYDFWPNRDRSLMTNLAEANAPLSKGYVTVRTIN
jgi:hypothetical protein